MNPSILRAYISLFEKNKITIIKYWLKEDLIQNFLKKYEITLQVFVKEYALGLLNFYIDKVYLRKEKHHIINNLLDLFTNKNIPSYELFTLINCFKNSLIEYTYDLKITNLQIEKEINNIFEKNFMPLLSKYENTKKDIEKKLLKQNSILDKYLISARIDTKGKVIEVSKAFCEISGFEKEEVLNEPYKIIFESQMPRAFFKDLIKTIKAGKSWHGEVQSKRKNSSLYWLDMRITPVFDEKEDLLYFDSICQDITLKKQLEDQQNILIEQSKSAAMGEMISMIAHQWRQPLQATSILIQKLPITKALDGKISDELLEQVVEGIGTQLEYMSKTIDDFRDFFLPHKEKELICVEELIQRALDFLSFMIKNDSIDIKIDKKIDIKIWVHVNELIQVIINLVKNSRDIFIERKIKERKIFIRYYIKDNLLYLEVEDNANGVPEDIFNKIFEPYFSTKDKKNGTGLGLYMCKTIIEQHSSGSLSLENSKIGALFKITLPLE